jgi:hypothetical protein
MIDNTFYKYLVAILATSRLKLSVAPPPLQIDPGLALYEFLK